MFENANIAESEGISRSHKPGSHSSKTKVFCVNRYVDLLRFEMEVTNILETKAYELAEEENVSAMKNWLWWEVLQLIKTFTNEDKENGKQ